MSMDFFGDALVLPNRPNWKQGVEVEWSFKTDIFTARDGGETRRALREKPRRRVDYSILLNGRAAQQFRTTLARYLRTAMVIPDFTAVSNLTIVGTYQSSEINYPDIPYWLRAGVAVGICTEGVWQIREVESARDGVITLTETATFTPGAKLAPAILGRLGDEQAVEKPTTTIATLNISFDEDPTSALDPIDPLAVEAVPTFRDFPILPFRPNWATPFKESFSRAGDVIDYGYGRTYTFLTETSARWTGSFTCLGRNKVMADSAVDFFLRRKGRLGSFYCPSWQRDMEIVSGAVEDSTEIIVEGELPYRLYVDSLIYRNIALVTRAGIVTAGVQQVAFTGGNTVFTLDAPLPAEAEDVIYVSWLLLVRFATDQFTCVWHTDRVAEFDFSVTTVLDRFYDLQIAGYRVTIGDDYVTFPPNGTPSEFIPMTVDGEFMLAGGDYAG